MKRPAREQTHIFAFVRNRPDNERLAERLLTIADVALPVLHSHITSQTRQWRDADVPSETQEIDLAHTYARFNGNLSETVRAILHVDTPHTPSLRVDSDAQDMHFDIRERTIILPRFGTQAYLDAGIAHEYAHDLTAQTVAPLDVLGNPDFRAYSEGIALGVERIVNTQHRGTKQLPCPLSIANSTRYLLEAYLMLCQPRYVPHEFSILHETLCARIETDTHLLPAYAIGHALCTVYETAYGPNIYAEALRDPRVVLE